MIEDNNNPNWMEDKLNEFYNGAVDNCISVIADMIKRIKETPASNEAVQNVMVLDAAITLLVNLKK